MQKDNTNLIHFSILSYIDKGLAFVLPLIVLYVFNDRVVYNELEYAYSIANILVYVFSVGYCYSFYGYKISDDKDFYLSRYIGVSCVSVLLTAVILTIISLIWPSIDPSLSVLVAGLITARTVLLLFVSFFSTYYRLIDKPVRVIYLSLSVCFSILTLLTLQYIINTKYNLLYSFAIPELLIPIVFCFCLLLKINIPLWSYLKDYYKASVIYSWPIVVNCFLALGVSNFGKIYAFNYMSDDDMYIFSYTMRISMVIWLAHNSIVAYYGKKIFMDEFNKSIAFKYLLFLMGSTVLSLMIIIILNNISKYQIPLNLSVFIIFAYNIVFCCGSFLEGFYGRANKNMILMYITIISALVFIIIMWCIPEKTILSISTGMLSYAILRFIFMIYGLDKLGQIYNFKKSNNFPL